MSALVGGLPSVQLSDWVVASFGSGWSQPVDVLAVGAHPDDVELACGGTLAVLAQQGVRVGVLDLTDGEPTPYGSPERRRQESHRAAESLGLASRITLRLPNRTLQDSVEARCVVASVIRLLRPQLLLAHYWEDAHPDHWAACQLAEAGRFYGKLTRTALPGEPHLVPRVLYFVASHLRLHRPVSFICDTTRGWARKREAIEAYRSQFYDNPASQGVPEAIELRDRYFGRLIGCRYGEPFVSREPVGVSDLRALLW